MKELKDRIEITKEIIEDGEYRNNYASRDSLIMLENQLIIMEALSLLLESRKKPNYSTGPM